ncbi:AAEL013364-PA [Aedes aegypti]|uniref:AAEL013364-PA n=1 Tax=Aedes aegypti TaxID=7159 RepID=Q16JD6_AEDAE|nr:AAEL013364-PA [Aedes aegypti]
MAALFCGSLIQVGVCLWVFVNESSLVSYVSVSEWVMCLCKCKNPAMFSLYDTLKDMFFICIVYYRITVFHFGLSLISLNFFFDTFFTIAKVSIKVRVSNYIILPIRIKGVNNQLFTHEMLLILIEFQLYILPFQLELEAFAHSLSFIRSTFLLVCSIRYILFLIIRINSDSSDPYRIAMQELIQFKLAVIDWSFLIMRLVL